MIPLKADLPTRSVPFITVALILSNVVMYLFSKAIGPNVNAMFFKYGAIPHQLIHDFGMNGLPAPVIKSLFSSMFLHVGFLHVGGNMLYLWIFGNNVEDELGHSKFLIFYLLCGVIAAYSHAFIESESKVPMVGASGAVSGILGAYFLLFPRAKILTLIPIGFFITTIRIPALAVIGVWVLGQLMYAVTSVKGQGGIAWFAHIGGFIAGLLLLRFFRKKRPRWRKSF